MTAPKLKISVVTPTFMRPVEILGLLDNLARQAFLPFEVIIVDGAPSEELKTEKAVQNSIDELPFKVRYLRQTGGTAVQRNTGINMANGDFIALIDDDVRLEEYFFKEIIDVFNSDNDKKAGGIVGYRSNGHFDLETSARWKWYKRLKLLTTFEPGHYDYNCGYPINNYLQPPFKGVRRVDFMTTACAVWRREVFAGGLRFHSFFRDYGVLEDAHFSLRARREWELLQCGDALCEELNSPNGRENRRKIGYKCVVNYYFVFQDIGQPLTRTQKFRFWRYQFFEFLRIAASAVRRRRIADFQEIVGRIEGVFAVLGGAARSRNWHQKRLTQ
jgi:glycosyltransferase involved in cell wall biosynthesis